MLQTETSGRSKTIAESAAFLLALCLLFATGVPAISQVNDAPDGYPGKSVDGTLRRLADKDLLLQTTSGKVLHFRLLAKTEFRGEDRKPVRDSLLRPGDGVSVYVNPDDVETAVVVVLLRSGSEQERQAASVSADAAGVATPELTDFVTVPPPLVAPKPANPLGTVGAASSPRPTLVVTNKVDPEYSPEARSAGLQGTVMLSLIVNQTGAVADVRLRRGLGMGLDERAVAAARQWQYKPFSANGPMMVAVEVPFRLESAGPWLVAGSNFAFTRFVKGKSEKPVISRYVSPDSGACPKELTYLPVQLTVGKNGKPGDVKVAPGTDEPVARAVTEAVGSWQFRPGTEDGSAEIATGTILLECGAPPSPGGGGISVVGNGTTPPSVVFKVDPEYSEAARKAKYSGSVMLSIVVDTTGRARDVKVVKALGMGLDEEAIAAIAQWRFKSGTNRGQPVNVRAQVEVNFRLL